MPARARRPDALSPSHVAAGNRPAPRRNAGSIRPPTPRTFAGGTLDTGGASAPRTSCRCVRSPALCPHIFGVRRRRPTVPVVRQRRREDGGRRRVLPLVGLGTVG